MAEWVGMWKSVSARRIAATLSIKPPVWQPDYFDRYLRSSESYPEKWQYVVQNPVRAGLVIRVEDWPCRGTLNVVMFLRSELWTPHGEAFIWSRRALASQEPRGRAVSMRFVSRCGV